jgi:hypothetical protein
MASSMNILQVTGSILVGVLTALLAARYLRFAHRSCTIPAWEWKHVAREHPGWMCLMALVVLVCSIAGNLSTDAHLFEAAGLAYGFGLAFFVFLVPSVIPTGRWWQLWQWKGKTR